MTLTPCGIPDPVRGCGPFVADGGPWQALP
jgi:hypothetical protein